MKLISCLFVPLPWLLTFAPAPAQDRDSIQHFGEDGVRRPPMVSQTDRYLFVYDGLYDMTGTARDLLSASHLCGRGVDELTCKYDPKTGFNYCGDEGRFPERVLIDGLNFLVTNWLTTIQHEFNGHGFRAREFNARINSSSVGSFVFGSPCDLDFHREDLPYYGVLLEETGGSESNTVLSREAYRQSLGNDFCFHYDVYALASRIDLPMYIFGTPRVGSAEWNSPTHWGDVVRYIKAFRSKSNMDEQHIYDSALKGAYWTLADPSLLLALLSYVRDFIVHGKSQVKNPMIEVGDVAFLPYTDFHLSPFGFEYYGGTYVRNGHTLFETYYRWSLGNIDGRSYGIGIVVCNLVRFESLALNAGVDLWKQGFNPLYYERDVARYHEKVLSGKLSMEAIYEASSTLSFLAQASYKGDGYLLGNPVSHGFGAGSGWVFGSDAGLSLILFLTWIEGGSNEQIKAHGRSDYR